MSIVSCTGAIGAGILTGEGGAVLAVGRSCFSTAAMLAMLEILDCEALWVSPARVVAAGGWVSFANGARGVLALLLPLVLLAVLVTLDADGLILVGIRDWWGTVGAVRALAPNMPIVFEGRSVLETRVNVEPLLLVDDVPTELLISISDTF